MLSFADAPGNLFNVLGKLGKIASQARDYQDSQLENIIDHDTGAVAQFCTTTLNEPDIQANLGASYITILDGAASAAGGMIQTVAAQTVNRMVFRDNPQISQTLDQLNVLISLQEVIRQMKIAGATVRSHTITATPTNPLNPADPDHFAGAGNGVVNVSVRRPSDGLVLENAFAENLIVLCSADSYIGGATEGNETLAITGEGQQSNPWAFNWPLGSNANTEVNAIDGNENDASGNLLTGTGFNSFTANIPTGWERIIGVFGTNYDLETGITYDGAGSLKITGDALGTLVEFRQEFGEGTSGELEPLTQYGFNIFVRRDAIAAGAGVWTVDLVDENNVVVQDASGSPQTFNIDLTTLTTQFASFRTQFRTPLVLPGRLFIRMRLSTALTDGRSVYFDKASLGEMVQIYIGGPYVCVHAGSIPFQQGDYSWVGVTNSRGAAGTLDTFQTLLARLFPEVLFNELIFPSSTVPFISDGLIA